MSQGIHLGARHSRLVLLVCLVSFACAGCSLFDREAQDRAACDKLSQVMKAEFSIGVNSENYWKSAIGTGPQSQFVAFVSEVQDQVLPLASMSFGETLNGFISSAKKTSSSSIFDVATGYSETTDKLSQVLARCLEVSGSN